MVFLYINTFFHFSYSHCKIKSCSIPYFKRIKNLLFYDRIIYTVHGKPVYPPKQSRREATIILSILFSTVIQNPLEPMIAKNPENRDSYHPDAMELLQQYI